jgi:glucose-1-phosphate thymidylyltransferase
MKIIVPMAGRGSRLRPHTLTVPKPLIPIAGKPIVQRLVEDIAKVAGEKIDEIAFIIGDFGPEVEAIFNRNCRKIGRKRKRLHSRRTSRNCSRYKMCRKSMQGDVVIAFAIRFSVQILF